MVAIEHETQLNGKELPTVWPNTLRFFRERAKCSKRTLALAIGVDPSYLTRIENGDREPPKQHILLALSQSLELVIPDRNILLVSAGYAPLEIREIGWEPALQAVAEVLTDSQLTPEDKGQFRFLVESLASHWKQTTR